MYDVATTDALCTENDLQMIRILTGDQLISRYQDIPPSQRLTDAFIGKLGDSERPGTAKRTIGLIFMLGRHGSRSVGGIGSEAQCLSISDQILLSSFLGGVGIHWDDNCIRMLHSER